MRTVGVLLVLSGFLFAVASNAPLGAFLVLVGLLFLALGQKGGGAAGSSRGTPARGIVLAAARTGTSFRLGLSGARYERRQVILDVEVPGQAPYTADVVATIVGNFVDDVLPGVTVELRIRGSNISIVGPGVALAMPPLVATSAATPYPPQR